MKSSPTAASRGVGIGVYIPPIPRLHSVIASANGTVIATARPSPEYDWPRETAPGPYFWRQQSSPFSRYAYDDYSDNEPDGDVDMASSSGKLLNPRMDVQSSEELLSAICLLVTEDPCSGRFVYGRQELNSKKSGSKTASMISMSSGGGGDNSKSQLQTLLSRDGHSNPIYRTNQIKYSQFRSAVEFNGMQFVGQPCRNKKLAEKGAATEALEWLMGGASSGSRDIDHMSTFVQKSKKHHGRA